MLHAIPFVEEIGAGNEAMYVLDYKNLTHFCSGRLKYKCKHGFFHACNLKMVLQTDSGRPRRCRKTYLFIIGYVYSDNGYQLGPFVLHNWAKIVIFYKKGHLMAVTTQQNDFGSYSRLLLNR